MNRSSHRDLYGGASGSYTGVGGAVGGGAGGYSGASPWQGQVSLGGYGGSALGGPAGAHGRRAADRSRAAKTSRGKSPRPAPPRRPVRAEPPPLGARGPPRKRRGRRTVRPGLGPDPCKQAGGRRGRGARHRGAAGPGGTGGGGRRGRRTCPGPPLAILHTFYILYILYIILYIRTLTVAAEGELVQAHPWRQILHTFYTDLA